MDTSDNMKIITSKTEPTINQKSENNNDLPTLEDDLALSDSSSCISEHNTPCNWSFINNISDIPSTTSTPSSITAPYTQQGTTAQRRVTSQTITVSTTLGRC